MTPETPRAVAVIPLAGVTADAALSPVAGVPAVARVVSALQECVGVERTVVVAGRGVAAVRTAVPGVAVLECPPPATRAQCLALALDHLGVEGFSPVLVGDHRAPLASAETAARVLAGLVAGAEVAVPALPMTDTVKSTDAGGAVRDTVDRETLRIVQYPRGYAATTLRAALAGADESCDEFAAVLAAGVRVAMVAGDADAVTAELPADVPLLEAIIATRR